jgi:hypothetical protein
MALIIVRSSGSKVLILVKQFRIFSFARALPVTSHLFRSGPATGSCRIVGAGLPVHVIQMRCLLNFYFIFFPLMPKTHFLAFVYCLGFISPTQGYFPST